MRTIKELEILADQQPDIEDVVRELIEFRTASDPSTIQCFFCYSPAVVEGWTKERSHLSRISVCRNHCNTLIGFQGKTDAEIDDFIKDEYDPKSD